MKKVCLLLITAVSVCFLSIHAFAGTGFVGFVMGDNSNDGLTESTPKKQLLDFNQGGVMDIIGKDGGTMVIVDRAYIGAHYMFPKMNGTLTITGKYGDKSFIDAGNPYNPIGGTLKGAGHRMMTLCTDTVLTDMILFQEAGQNTIIVSSGTTLTITDTVQILKHPDIDCYWKVFIHAGGTAILSEEALEKLDIVNRGGTVRVYKNDFSKTTVLKMAINKNTADVNGVAHTLDAFPIIRNGRTMFPVRFVAETLGATVEWDGSTSTAHITGVDGDTVSITIGERQAMLNGKAVELDVPAFIEKGRTYLPVRFVAESLGAAVNWDGSTATATISKENRYVSDVDTAQFDTPTTHSPLYFNGISAEEMVFYFHEFFFKSKVASPLDGRPRVCKWNEPIYYSASGACSADDLKTLDELATYLNSIEGFPGMYEGYGENVNMNIGFTNITGGEVASHAPEKGTYWYSQYDFSINKAEIEIFASEDSRLRKASIYKAVYLMLSSVEIPIYRTDSIFRHSDSEVNGYTDTDKFLLELLYNPNIKSGMSYHESEAVIREIYY